MDVALQSAGNPQEPAVHGTRSFPHGPSGLTVVPAEVASYLQHNGGYRRATAGDIQTEIDVLEARLVLLRDCASRL
jgi:hypothetical protein